MKVVEHKKLSNFHVGSFSSCYSKSKVILEILFCPNSKIWNFFDLSLIFKLFGKITLDPLRISLGHLNMICSLQNLAQLLFWWKFDFSSSFGRISQKDKLDGCGLLQCLAGGVLCRRGRAASARNATQLATQLLAAVLRADGLIHIPCSAAWIKPRTAGVFFSFL